jgi:alpha-ketoglutarate-dependent taurine dioxygenase
MDRALPHVVKADLQDNLQAWIAENRSWVDATLDNEGAILFRNFCVSTESDFRALVNTFSSQPLQYMYRSTPRTTLGDGVYTATEYPAGHTIPQHNENSYQREWPLRLLFFCEYPAQGGGGQTPLANSVNVTNRIEPTIRKKFRDKKVMYIRNYREDIDLPWQTVFQTTSKADVEQFCRVHDISYEWTGPDSLRTKQVCHAFGQHPRTGATVWFNQAHLFHPSSLDDQTHSALLEMFKEQDFPRNATYGDGSPFDESELANIRDAYARETVTFQWKAQDVLLVDNMLVSHGRTPFKGKRRILVGMCEQFTSTK